MNRHIALLGVLLSGCPAPVPDSSATDDTAPEETRDREETQDLEETRDLVAIDVGIESGFQEEFLGSYQRGRACLAADFDNDGRIDLFIGHPLDESYLLRNTSEPGALSLERAEIPISNLHAFGGGPADYDNDGDYDLFISMGGSEQEVPDLLLENQLIESGTMSFVDVTEQAGVAGPLRGGSTPLSMRSANSRWGDYDRDGDLDLFVSAALAGVDVSGASCGSEEQEDTYDGRNTLWRNNGDGTFTDVTEDAGLADSLRSTWQSSWIDVDNDGDLDLYENNLKDINLLYINLLDETGSPTFQAPSTDPDEYIQIWLNSEPLDLERTLSSLVGDLNNDGWADLLIPIHDATRSKPSNGFRHLLFINTRGLGRDGFIEASQASGLVAFDEQLGPMGAQLGDLNGDGILDIFLGTGGPTEGNINHLHLSTGYSEIEVPGFGALRVPAYTNRSDLIDIPAQVPDDFSGHVPAYPYRSHGTCIVDLDGDGQVELAITNGGRVTWPDDESQAPNRLFQLFQTPTPGYLTIRPRGDGVAVPRDGIGTRVVVTARDAAGETWTIHRTLYGGSGFSAHNGFQLSFGLANAVAVDEVEVTWSDGVTELLEDVEIDSILTIQR
ncbi:MAG: hypothetical protein ACI8RZ_001141 [Myxococcota bacterium]|jgi:hypothetical protein